MERSLLRSVGLVGHVTGIDLLAFVCWLEDLEAAHEGFVDGHHGARVVKLSTVVGRAEECDELAAVEELVTILHDLVGTANKIDVVLVCKLADDSLAKDVADTSIVFCVAIDTPLRVRPEQITEETHFWHICRPDNILDLVQTFQFWAQTTVHAENFVVNEGCDWQAIEHVAEDSPEPDGVATFALVIKAVDSVDLGALVVATQQKEVFGVLDLVAQEQTHCLDRLLSTVDIVTQEQVV